MNHVHVNALNLGKPTSAVLAHRTAQSAHLQRAAATVGVHLPGDGPLEPRDYALAHHFSFAMKAAISAGESDSVAPYVDQLVERWRSLADPSSASMTFGGIQQDIVAASSCRRVDDDRYESPLYLAVEERVGLDDADRTRWEAAERAIELAGLEAVVHAVTGVVVLLDKRGSTETTNSYTLRALRGTIFMDHVDDPVRLGEIVLHESAHTFLNDLFDASHTVLSPEAKWFSPWKNVRRPAHGILHAGFAFGILQRYFESHASAEPGSSSYARMRAEIGMEQRAAARTAVAQAAAEIADDRVRSFVLRTAD